MNNKVYLAVIGILIIICAALFYKVSQKSGTIEKQEGTIEETQLERDRLEVDLERVLISYDTLNTENATLIAEMAAQRAMVEDLLRQVKNKNWSIAKLKKESGTLRDIMQGYVFTIDSINTLNQNLIAERDALTQTLDHVQGENKTLEERQVTMEGMIAAGQILQTTDILTAAIRLRSNGKQSETSRASRTEMVKTCFTLLENRIAEPGKKNLYLRIIGPDGKVLPAKSGETQSDFDGEMQGYSVSRQIDYNKNSMDVCIFYSVQSELPEGDYNVFIYQEGNKIASSILSLK
jgi:hypothetical protein